mmetsp:Transcript_89165/g.238036  ORF Transcript_89165/g.238036 Transcript_89165/m.238036 type:complete len:335 (+) Transcript_89165:310-1314(+)
MHDGDLGEERLLLGADEGGVSGNHVGVDLDHIVAQGILPVRRARHQRHAVGARVEEVAVLRWHGTRRGRGRATGPGSSFRPLATLLRSSGGESGDGCLVALGLGGEQAAKRQASIEVVGLARRAVPALVVRLRDQAQEIAHEPVGVHEGPHALHGLLLAAVHGQEVADGVVGDSEDGHLGVPGEQVEEACCPRRVVELVHGGAAESVKHTRDGRHGERRCLRQHSPHNEDALELLLRGELVEVALPRGTEEGHGAVEVHVDGAVGREVKVHLRPVGAVHVAFRRLDVAVDADVFGCQQRLVVGFVLARGVDVHLILDRLARERVHVVDTPDGEE